MRIKTSNSNQATRLSFPEEGPRMILSHFRPPLLAFAGSCALLLAVTPASAQQDAASSSGQNAEPSSAPQESEPQSPPGPVGGVEAYRFPGPALGRSFFIPRFSLQELYNSNSGYSSTSNGSQEDSVTSITGGLSLQWVKRDSTLSLDYASEGLLYARQTQPNGVVQQLGLTEKVVLPRWNLLFGENFSYLPNSAFGLGGLGYLGGGTSGLPGVGGVTNFNPFQTPTQTIVSPNVTQLSSASVFQAQYLISGTSSLSGSVNVGFLHFFGADLLNSRSITARFGYDKALTPRDTINFNYQATILDYASGIPGFTSHYIQVGYRRILTGRLHFSASAGPSITHFSPMVGQTAVPGGSNLVNWSLSSSLDYALRNGSLNARYSHGTAGGSGYLVGSVQDQFSGQFAHSLSRVWKATFTGGFAHNGAFQQTVGAAVSPSASFNYWFAGGSISRPIGRYSSLAFSYNASRQTASTTVCANNLPCGPIALVQVVGLTFNWSTRPYKLE
jgi:hypothetical protein